MDDQYATIANACGAVNSSVHNPYVNIAVAGLERYEQQFAGDSDDPGTFLSYAGTVVMSESKIMQTYFMLISDKRWFPSGCSRTAPSKVVWSLSLTVTEWRASNTAF